MWKKSGVVVHNFNLSAWEAGAGESLLKVSLFHVVSFRPAKDM